MAYVDGFIIPVKTARRADYEAMAKFAAPIFIEYGAVEVVENWGADVPKGVTTDFFGAVKAEPDETIVFSWIIWPDKQTRDAGNKACMEDPRFEKFMDNPPFDGKRMIFAGFETLFTLRK